MDILSLEKSAREVLGWSDIDIARSRPIDITNAIHRTQQSVTQQSLTQQSVTQQSLTQQSLTQQSVPKGDGPKTQLPMENLSKPYRTTTVPKPENISSLRHGTPLYDMDIQPILLNRVGILKKIMEYEEYTDSCSHTIRPMLSLLHCRLSLLTTKLDEIRRDIVSRIEERQHIVDIVKSDLSNSDLYDVTNNLPTMKDAIVADEMYIATLSKKLSTIT